MKFLFPLLFTVAAALADGGHWNKAPQPAPTNVQYGPWVTQPHHAGHHRDQKGIASIFPDFTALRNFGDFWTFDRESIFKGIFANDNIMIHVGQNFFNFIFTTLAWFLVSQIYSSGLARHPNLARSGKSVTFTEAADEVLQAIKDFEKRHEE